MYKFPHMIGATSSMISGQNRPNETPYRMYVILDVHITLLWLLRGWNTKSGRYQIPPNVMIPNHHNKNKAQTRPRKQELERGQKHKLNVEDHIASTPTGYGRKPIPRIGSWQSAAYTDLLVDIVPLSNWVWDQAYPYRHVAIRNKLTGREGLRTGPYVTEASISHGNPLQSSLPW